MSTRTAGRSRLRVYQVKDEGFSQGMDAVATEEPLEIRLEAGDDYCQRQGITHVDFIKVDVEGHELAVFQGLRALLAAGGVDFLQFEYGGAYIDARILLKDIFEFFAPLPYDLCKVYPRWVQKVERYVQQLETFQYQNWLIVRRGLPLP